MKKISKTQSSTESVNVKSRKLRFYLLIICIQYRTGVKSTNLVVNYNEDEQKDNDNETLSLLNEQKFTNKVSADPICINVKSHLNKSLFKCKFKNCETV